MKISHFLLCSRYHINDPILLIGLLIKQGGQRSGIPGKPGILDDKLIYYSLMAM